MTSNIQKLMSLVLIVSIFALQFPAGVALAFYNDFEFSQANHLDAGIIDIALDSASDFFPAVTPTQSATREIEVQNISTLNNQYTARFENFDGAVCDVLNVQAFLNDNPSPVYTGALKGFNYQVFLNGAPQKWKFVSNLTSDDGKWQNQVCKFDVVYRAWQTNYAAELKGFHDTEIMANTIIATGNWIPSYKCDQTIWNPGSLKIDVINSYDGSCLVENFTFKVDCISGNNVDCNAVGLTFVNAMGVNAMHQITPPFPEGMTAMLGPSSPLSGQGVVWLMRPVPAQGKTYSVNVQHPVKGYDSSYGAFIVYGDTCTGETKTQILQMPAYATCTGGAATTLVNFVKPTPNYQGKIVMNELLVNPLGMDAQTTGLNGEWIELYNNDASTSIDINDWYFTNKDGGKLTITPFNTWNGNTTIAPKSFAVVFANTSYMENFGDTITLFDKDGVQLDTYTYNGNAHCALPPSAGGTNDDQPWGDACLAMPFVSVNKSLARIPDGIGQWKDPIPTPGAPNREEIIVNPAPVEPSSEDTSSVISVGGINASVLGGATTTPTTTNETNTTTTLTLEINEGDNSTTSTPIVPFVPQTPDMLTPVVVPTPEQTDPVVEDSQANPDDGSQPNLIPAEDAVIVPTTDPIVPTISAETPGTPLVVVTTITSTDTNNTISLQ